MAEKKLKVEDWIVAQEKSHPAVSFPIQFFILLRPPGWRYCPSRIILHPIARENSLRRNLEALTQNWTDRARHLASVLQPVLRQIPRHNVVTAGLQISLTPRRKTCFCHPSVMCQQGGDIWKNYTQEALSILRIISTYMGAS